MLNKKFLILLMLIHNISCQVSGNRYPYYLKRIVNNGSEETIRSAIDCYTHIKPALEMLNINHPEFPERCDLILNICIEFCTKKPRTFGPFVLEEAGNISNLKYVLFYAAIHGRIKIIQKLMDLNISLDVQNDDSYYGKIGKTTLMYAAENNQAMTVLFLLLNNANPDIKDKPNGYAHWNSDRKKPSLHWITDRSEKTFYDYAKDKPAVLDMIKEYRKKVARQFDRNDIIPDLALITGDYVA